MGHVLGIGTIWTDLGLLAGAGTLNSRFLGVSAVNEYNTIFGVSSSSVPVENSGGEGTRDGHWRESVFDNEVMTGYINAGFNPLSRVTIASLADLGYLVNINAADFYGAPGSFAAASGSLTVDSGHSTFPELSAYRGPVTISAQKAETAQFVAPASNQVTLEPGNLAAQINFGSRPFAAGGARKIVTAADAGGLPLVRVYDAQTLVEQFSFLAFDARFAGGVRVATGDINHDGVPDVITAAGPGGGPHIRVLDGVTGEQLPGRVGSFFAFDAGFTGGVFVSAGDVNGDGRTDIVVAADAGGGPHVRVFNGSDGSLLSEFYAFDANFRGGVRIALADVDNNGSADVVAATGPGSAPMVRIFNGMTGTAITSVRSTFSPYAASFAGGVYVTAADFNGDGDVEIATGAGPGGGPHVKVFDVATGAVLSSFFAYHASFAGGVRLASAHANGDATADLVTAAGPGGGPHVRIFDGLTARELKGLFTFEPSFTGGVFLGGDATAADGLTQTRASAIMSVVDDLEPRAAAFNEQAGGRARQAIDVDAAIEELMLVGRKGASAHSAAIVRNLHVDSFFRTRESAPTATIVTEELYSFPLKITLLDRVFAANEWL
jgi:hypothetical protein